MSSTNSDRSTKVRTGSCLCKAVKYEVAGDPITFRICHCQNCKKATGSAFMTNVFFTEDKLRVTEGQEKLKVYHDHETASGNVLSRYFCSQCGSNVFLQSSDKRAVAGKIRIIAAGTLDEEFDWVPKTQLWPELKQHFIHGITTTAKL
ncbi:hypothetical protein JR316_0006526 [Psilocybe cubensis]|uniref:Uncharacterized protein n=2 Tax=Psilocybe cubensis TaxID=181762 RepID=A0ACB8H2C9_PSICU|nr:hypothetical protein JR316_0006526 [Psilocybe cubensis]KAH9481996.1 hypothetical protein JR316_0006526 [Psilocybe cubensis]